MKSYELDTAGYEHIGTADDGGGYDWSQFDVWFKDGVFYWASDSGCSCYGPYEDDIFPDRFEGHGTAHEALHALTKNSQFLTASEIEPLLFKLMDYRPGVNNV